MGFSFTIEPIFINHRKSPKQLYLKLFELILIIQKSLEDLSKDRTCITIAHRLSTIRNADEIVVIDATGMHERGTHDELMKLNGTYAKYYKLQFEGLNQQACSSIVKLNPIEKQ